MHHTGDAGGGGGCLADSSQGLSQSRIVRRVLWDRFTFFLSSPTSLFYERGLGTW